MQFISPIAFTVLVCLMSIQSADACMCKSSGRNFFETVSLHNQKIRSGEWSENLALTIVMATVKQHLQLRPGPLPTEMVLDITGVVQGEVEQTELVVEGDNGAQCRPYVTQFPIGENFIFALNKEGETYSISVCGQYSLEISQS